MPPAIFVELRDVIRRHASPAVYDWLDGELATAADAARLRVAFARAGRQLGTHAIDDADAERLARAGVPWRNGAGIDECGRAALLLAFASTRPDHEHVEVVGHLYRRGEVRERQAVVRVLPALPHPARFTDLAIEACRTNVRPVFDAIACDNVFPSRHFDDPAFHQMVLKALFVGAPLACIVGLVERTTPELVRMVEAFASERRAAARDVPADLELIRRAR